MSNAFICWFTHTSRFLHLNLYPFTADANFLLCVLRRLLHFIATPFKLGDVLDLYVPKVNYTCSVEGETFNTKFHLNL
jgi:hypothetical protein